MPDWVSTSEGRHLRGRKKFGTDPEVLLRKALHARGARFRLHRHLAQGCRPDICLPKHRLAIFVDGCFWHGCPIHGRNTTWTGPNAELWAAKMRRNAERDERASKLAGELGWRVIRIWECAVRRDAEGAAAEVMALSEQAGE